MLSKLSALRLRLFSASPVGRRQPARTRFQTPDEISISDRRRYGKARDNSDRTLTSDRCLVNWSHFSQLAHRQHRRNLHYCPSSHSSSVILLRQIKPTHWSVSSTKTSLPLLQVDEGTNCPNLRLNLRVFAHLRWLRMSADNCRGKWSIKRSLLMVNDSADKNNCKLFFWCLM